MNDRRIADTGPTDAGPTGPVPGDETRTEVERDHLRGSSLMLVGRVLSLVLNLIVQVVAVRYLGKTDYGVFAYAVSWSSIGSSVALLGQDQSLGRFLPRYETSGEPGRAQGAMVVAFATVSIVGMTLASLAIGLTAMGVDLGLERQAVTVLVVLLASSPLLAIDELFQNLFAVVARPTAIFFRRHVLTPGMRLAATVFVVATAGSVVDLAWLYLLAAVVGTAVYVSMAWRVLRVHPLLDRGDQPRHYPVREMLRFGVPVYGSDMVNTLRSDVVIVILEALRSVREVATYRAVWPIAHVNTVGLDSFRLLFFPVVSRLFALDDHDGIKRLYWQSASWIAVVTFPVFVATVTLAEPVTELLFGDEFADSAPVLAVLSLGLYVSAALGLNTLTLRASGKVRMLVRIESVVAISAIVMTVPFVAWFGAVGAAIATTASIIVQNALTHAGLHRILHGLPMSPEHRRTYLSLIVAGGALTAFHQLVDPPLAVALVLGTVTSVAILWGNRRALAIGSTFPELAKIPILRRLAE